MNLMGQSDMTETQLQCYADNCHLCWLKLTFLLQLEKRAEAAGWSSPNRTGTGTYLQTGETQALVSLVKELIIFFRYTLGTLLECQTFSSESFVLHAASSETKDCLQLLKLLGVPVIQVKPAKRRVYTNVYIFMLSLYFFPSICAFLYLRLLCSRLQGMLRHYAPGWWGRGLWMLWDQRIWTHCRLGPIFSFANLTARRTGRLGHAIDVSLKTEACLK